ncbi:MAG: ferritin-like domain-containing protein [Nitrospinae bacterium]|nr:ferritin-like domain-containing protein [Nitrospinota bacterium]
MGITKKELIDKLNKDLEWEYAAMVQYIQHSAAITGAKYDSVRKELIIHAQEEMSHAVILSTQIDYLGATPTVNVEKVEISSESLTMLKQDLKGERHAIESYKQRIGEAEELKEYGLRRALEDILIQEEEHERDLLSAIKE